MRAYTRRRLLASAKLGLAAVPLTIMLRMFQGAEYPYRSGIVLGLGFGFLVGVAELFLMRNWLKHLPFLLHLTLKSLILVCVMGLGFVVLNTLDVFVEGDTWRQYLDSTFHVSSLVGLVQGFGVIAFLLFFVQLDRLLGPGVLLGYVTGRYHKPRREQRMFMFLDLKGSTTLADEMTADRYFGFLHRYFTEMSESILETDAEIYQYVGDEVVLTWRTKSGLEEANCIRVFFLIRDQIQAQRDRFLHDFGSVPEFKAGVHAGEVITAQIGELKKEIVYNGDVLNTTARIQAMCNELGHSLLVSAELLDALDASVLQSAYRIDRLGPVPLRGKGQATELCAVYRASEA